MSEKFGNLPWSRIFQIRKQKEMSEKFRNLPWSRFFQKRIQKEMSEQLEICLGVGFFKQELRDVFIHLEGIHAPWAVFL